MRKNLFQNIAEERKICDASLLLGSGHLQSDTTAQTDVFTRILHTLMVPKAKKEGLHQATPPCPSPAEVAAFLVVIDECRSSRLTGLHRVPPGFSTAGSAVSSKGMTEFFQASVNILWAFLHTEAWRKYLNFKTLVLNQIEAGLGLGGREATLGRSPFSSMMRLIMQSLPKLHSPQSDFWLFSEADFLQGVSPVCHKNKRSPTGNTEPGEEEGTIGGALAMSSYEQCPQMRLRLGFSVPLSSRFIWFSLGTTSPHTAIDLVKDRGVTAIFLLLLLPFRWREPVGFLLTIPLWKLHSYILCAGILLHMTVQ